MICFGRCKRLNEILLFLFCTTKVSQPCEQMMLYCRYGTETFECLVLFNSVLTDEGLCCIFNGIHPKFLLKSYKLVKSSFGNKNISRF